MQIELNPHSEAPRENPNAPPRAMGATPRVEVTIWNPNATANWSLLFTPAFGAYLQALNWEALGEPDRARSSRIWFYVTLAFLVLLIPLGYVGPRDEFGSMVPRGLAFWYLIIWYFASGRAQGKFVKEHHGKDYTRRPWGQTLLIALGAIVGYTVITFMIGVIWALLRR